MTHEGFLGELERAGRPLVIGSLRRDNLLLSVCDPANDLQGHAGCVELLNIDRPDLVADHHRSLVQSGAEALSTNTIGAAKQNMDGYRMKDESFAVTFLAAEIAVGVARLGPAHSGRPVTVLGDVRVPWHMPLLGFITCREVEATVTTLVSGLAAGGVDAIHLQTAHHPDHLAAAFAGARAGLAEARRKMPVLVSVRHDLVGGQCSRDDVRNSLIAAASLAYGLRASAVSVEAANLGSETFACLAKQIAGPLFLSPSTPLALTQATLADSAIFHRLRLVSAGRADEIWRLSRLVPMSVEDTEQVFVTANANLNPAPVISCSRAD